MSNYKEERPWGEFEVLLDNSICKVKKIVVKPDQALSYQYHLKRSEVWTIIQGSGELILNDTTIQAAPGYTYHIEKGAKHRIMNNGSQDLIFIETQLGDYSGEDDIVRLTDKYGRK